MVANLKRIILEIHRRLLWQAFIAYFVVSVVVLEVSVAIAERRDLPGWFTLLSIILLIIGLPVVLTTAALQKGIPQIGRSGPTLKSDGEKPETSLKARSGGARDIFTWRNAILGGVAAFTLWALVAAGWLALAGDLVDGAAESAEVVEDEP